MDVFKKVVCFLLIAAVSAGLLLAACAKSAPAPAPAQAPAPKTAPAASPAPKPVSQLPKSLIFGSQPIGTSTYVVCTGLASVMEKYSGMKVIVQPLASTPLLYNELCAGRLSVTLQVQGDSYLAHRGEEEYKEAGPRAIRQLGTGNAMANLWITRPDTGIKSFPDMVGKKVMYISEVNPATTQTYRLCLEYYGILEKVTSLKRGSMETAAVSLIEKKVDVIGGPYGTFGYDVQNATGIVAIPINEEVTKYIREKKPGLCPVMGTYPAGYYGLPQAVKTYSRVKEMTVTPAMSDDVAYAITKAIYDHPDDCKAIHRDVGEFSIDNAISFSFFIPTHPGAIRYYKEKGIWTKEHDQLQEKLLATEQQLLPKKK